jgi:hypothetical protein
MRRPNYLTKGETLDPTQTADFVLIDNGDKGITLRPETDEARAAWADETVRATVYGSVEHEAGIPLDDVLAQFVGRNFTVRAMGDVSEREAATA